MSSCIPFLSQYDDCNDATGCHGCNRCTCDADGHWSCYRVYDTCNSEGYGIVSVDDNEMDTAVSNLMSAIMTENEEKEAKPKLVVPLPKKKISTTQGPPLEYLDIDREIDEAFRKKRSVVQSKSNNDTESGVKFYHTVDEINEDTLKNSNISGTFIASKVDVHSGKTSRRTGVLDNSSQNPLHIQYNDPKIHNRPITDNKIDSSHIEDKYDALSKDKIVKLNSNYTSKEKDKNLSKLVVNELKSGTEIIGDTKGPILSNITFTPENDTLTAMAFIAGNLLNKLWNIEKDSTEDSIETEVLKHQKIADLLELFKEPMTHRQERFLKDALEKLSDALNKNNDIQNISLCETVEEVKSDINQSDHNKQVKTCDTKKNNDGNKNEVVVNAISKINNVLGLVKRYDDVQKNLHDLKHPRDKPVLRNSETPESSFSEDEKESLNIFGNILEKITKLLIPRNNKKITKNIRNHHIFSKSLDLNDKVKKKFNIDLKSLKLSPKDKLVLDYINKMQTNPCSLSTLLEEDKSIRNTESDILFNLSEFFKIKSFSDLLKVVAPEHLKPVTENVVTSTTTENVVLPRTTNSMFTTEFNDAKNNKPLNLKDKLKIHLKTILNDLIELQNEKGLKSGDINIEDVMPCLFNMLNDDALRKKPKKYTRNDLINKVKSVLDVVKKEGKKTSSTRRNNAETGPRPKSAVLWERVVKNLNRKDKPSRRNFNKNESKSYDELQKLMEKIEADSFNTYKKYVFLYDVPAAEKLVLLKTLDLDNKKNLEALEKLQELNNLGKLPPRKLDDIQGFVDTAFANVNLNERVLISVDKPKQKKFKVEKTPIERAPRISSFTGPSKQALKVNEENNDNFKMTREQILNQLIKNRVELYLKIREAQEGDINDDMKYSIARRIILNLENGNNRLAQELFKVFVDNKKQTENNSATSQSARSRLQTSLKQPLVQFRRSKPQPWMTQEQLLKQLLNIKTMSE